jgi:hypothetical protein
VGLRTILLLAAVVLFILSVVASDGNLGGLGLACFAGAFLVDELGYAGMRFGPDRRRTPPT